LAVPVLELADLGDVDAANLAVGPIEIPLVGLRIVGAQGQALDVSSPAVDVDLVDVGAVPDLPADARALEIDPLVGARQRIQSAPQVILPRAEKRIEVVRSVAFLDLRLRRGRTRLRHSARRIGEKSRSENRGGD